jgi:hypothetical protein
VKPKEFLLMLAHFRDTYGFSERQIDQIAGLSKGRTSDWLSHRRKPTPEAMYSVAPLIRAAQVALMLAK